MPVFPLDSHDAVGSAPAHEPLAMLRDLVVAQQESDRDELAPALGAGDASEQSVVACVTLMRWLRSSDFWTYERLADHLNSHEQLTRRGEAWTKGSVGYALTNARGDQQ